MRCILILGRKLEESDGEFGERPVAYPKDVFLSLESLDEARVTTGEE
jgi:hypothetical protein